MVLLVAAVTSVTCGATYSLLGVFFLVSARRRDVASVAGLWFTDRLLFFFLFFIYSGSNLSRYLSDRRNFLTDTRVMDPTCQRTSRISKICVIDLCHRVQKTAKKADFHVFFTGWPHFFDRCTKTVCARRHPKTNMSSTMNYLSSDTTLITVVLVVLQITA